MTRDAQDDLSDEIRYRRRGRSGGNFTSGIWVYAREAAIRDERRGRAALRRDVISPPRRDDRVGLAHHRPGPPRSRNVTRDSRVGSSLTASRHHAYPPRPRSSRSPREHCGGGSGGERCTIRAVATHATD